MIEELKNKGYIVNEATGLDWSYHKGNKEVHVAGQGSVLNEMAKSIPSGVEYMIIRDFKDEKEYEFSVIVKEDDKYYFVTDSPGTIKE